MTPIYDPPKSLEALRAEEAEIVAELEKLRQDIAWMNDRLLTSGPELVVLRW